MIVNRPIKLHAISEYTKISKLKRTVSKTPEEIKETNFTSFNKELKTTRFYKSKSPKLKE